LQPSSRNAAQRKSTSFEDIVVLVQAAKELGIKKVRLTGGEPLLRRDIDKLVAMLHELDVTVHTTTNGFMLARLAEPPVPVYISNTLISNRESINNPEQISFK